MTGQPLTRSPRAARRRARLRLGAVLCRLAAVLGLVVAALFGAATPASAHATLLLTDPADGSRLAALPAAVTLTFNQPVLGIGSVVNVTGPGGLVSSGRPELVDREVRQATRAGAPAGAYTVQWRLTSVDGHVISGRFGFVVGAGGAGAVGGAAPPAAGGGVSPLLWVLIAAGALVLVGAVALALRGAGPSRDPEEGVLP